MNSIIFGVLAAFSWGSADFAGGLSSRQIGAFLAVLYSEIFGLVLLIVAIPLVQEPIPPLNVWLFSSFSGALGSFALMLLYHLMATGKMSIAAPVSALSAVALPVIVGAFTEGMPKPIQLLGFVFALAAAWLITQADGKVKPNIERLADLRLPLLAGLGFGVYFVLMHQASQQATLWPMIASRTGGMLALLVFLFIRHDSLRIPRAAWPLIALTAVPDVGGNLFFILAGQGGRMDIAAVISSLYPGFTALLAWWLLKERIGRMQSIGVMLALAAIALIAL